MGKLEPSGAYFSKRDLRLRYLALALSLSPILGAYLYNKGYQIPYGCPIRHFTGIPCPTCGMTRSLMAAVRGEWITAADYHLFGPILLVILSGVTTLLVIEILTQRSTLVLKYLNFYRRRFLVILLCMLFGYHLTRLIIMHQNGVLGPSFFNSPLSQFLTALGH